MLTPDAHAVCAILNSFPSDSRFPLPLYFLSLLFSSFFLFYFIFISIKKKSSSSTSKVRQDIDTGGPTPLALGLANQHQAIRRLAIVPVMAPASAPVLDGERRGDLFAIVADDLGQGPEFLLLLGGNPAFDEDEVGVLNGGIGPSC